MVVNMSLLVQKLLIFGSFEAYYNIILRVRQDEITEHGLLFNFKRSMTFYPTTRAFSRGVYICKLYVIFLPTR